MLVVLVHRTDTETRSCELGLPASAVRANRLGSSAGGSWLHGQRRSRNCWSRVGRSWCGWCDHGVRSVLDSSVHGTVPAVLRCVGQGSASRGRGCVSPGAALVTAAGGSVLLVVAYWRTNLTLRELAPLFGVSKSAAARIVRCTGPLLALKQRHRFHKGAVLIVDGARRPAHPGRRLAHHRSRQGPQAAGHLRAGRRGPLRLGGRAGGVRRGADRRSLGAHPRPRHWPTGQKLPLLHNHQIVLDADSSLVVAVGRPVPGNSNEQGTGRIRRKGDGR